AWLRLFGGYGIASFFLSGAGTPPDFAVPFRLTPIPALLAFVLAFVIVLSGTLYSAWRAAAVPPREAMRCKEDKSEIPNPKSEAEALSLAPRVGSSRLGFGIWDFCNASRNAVTVQVLPGRDTRRG